MILPGSYTNGFAPRDGQPLYPELWADTRLAMVPGLGPTGARLADCGPRKVTPTMTAFNPATDWVESRDRYAIRIGEGGYVTVPQMSFTGDFTYHMWVMFTSYIDSGPNNHQYFITAPSLPFNYAVLRLEQTIYLRCGSEFVGWLFSTVTLGQWIPLTIVRAGGVASFYRSGVQVGTSQSIAGTGYWGGIDSVDSHPTNVCHYDDVLVIGRAMSPRSIALLHSRRGIANELAPRRMASVFLPSHLHYISGSAVRQGSIITGASPLGNVSKIQRAGDISPIPEERFDDRRYYYT